MLQPSLFGGLQILESNHCADTRQFRFPRSKKKRIRKKWEKRPENYRRVPWKYAIHDTRSGLMVMHPLMAAELRRTIAERPEVNLFYPSMRM